MYLFQEPWSSRRLAFFNTGYHEIPLEKINAGNGITLLNMQRWMKGLSYGGYGKV